MTTKPDIRELLARQIDPFAWEETPDPEERSLNRNDTLETADAQLAALKEAGLAVVVEEFTPGSFGEAIINGKELDERDLMLIWRTLLAAGRLDT